MASSSETGHAKNLANLQKLIDLCTQIGSAYNPNNTQLTLTGMNTLKTGCKTDYDGATTVDDVKSLIHKIKGYSNKIKTSTAKTVDPNAADTNPTPTTDGATPQADTSISTSQQSFDSLLANFDKLIQQLQGMSGYAPNEANIKLTALQTLKTNLETTNTAAITAYNKLALTRNQRNMSFYAPNTGLYDISRKVKKYIRQIFGSTNSIYHQATALKFVKIVPRRR